MSGHGASDDETRSSGDPAAEAAAGPTPEPAPADSLVERRRDQDRRSCLERRAGRDRRGQPRPAWTPEPDPTTEPAVRPYHFRSFTDRRERPDRRILDRRLGPATVDLTAAELNALLSIDAEPDIDLEPGREKGKK